MKARDWCTIFFNHYEIWWTTQQHCYQATWYISKWDEHFLTQFHELIVYEILHGYTTVFICLMFTSLFFITAMTTFSRLLEGYSGYWFGGPETPVIEHYSDITWVSWLLKSPETQLFIHQLVQTYNKENIKSLHYLSFVLLSEDCSTTTFFICNYFVIWRVFQSFQDSSTLIFLSHNYFAIQRLFTVNFLSHNYIYRQTSNIRHTLAGI